MEFRPAGMPWTRLFGELKTSQGTYWAQVDIYDEDTRTLEDGKEYIRQKIRELISE